MKPTKLLSRLSLALLTSTLLPATVLVLPGDRATTEGNGATLTGAFFGANTLQLQVAETELLGQGLLPGYVLHSLQLRLNDTSNLGADSTIADLEILLGQAANGIASMSTVFGDNITNAITVHDGAYTFAGGSLPSGGSPNGFGPPIAFSSGYVYQGGDLVIEIRRTPASVGFALDASSSHAGAGVTYRAVTGGFPATSGTLTNHFPVMQLGYAVPEPSSALLLLSGLALAGAGAGARRWHGMKSGS
jgi:hypothetical protein